LAEVEAANAYIEQETERLESAETQPDRDKAKAKIAAKKAQMDAVLARLDELDTAIEAETERYNAAVRSETDIR